MENGTAIGGGAEARPIEPDLRLERALLAEFQKTAEAERVARLELDRDRLLRIALGGYRGPEWERMKNDLAGYGHRVMRGWIKSGAIYGHCARKRVALRPTGFVPRGDDIRDIASDIVAAAARSFRDNVLVPSRWDHTRGATLRTFFIGQCLFHAPNAFRRWANEQKRMLPDAESGALPEPPYTRDDPVVSLELNRILDQIRRGEAQGDAVMVGVGMGYEHDEIASMLGKTRRAVEGVAYRRRQARR